MNGAEFLVRCLENEGVEYIFGIPGEENIHVMDELLSSSIQFITVRHEQGAAFMADVYGRLTGRPGVCLSTLGPGATNLVTGFADANMDCAPIVAIAGQGSTTRMHKESHQILDLVALFRPISKYSTGIRSVEVISEVVRKAFKFAALEKPGGSFFDFPENIASMEVGATERALDRTEIVFPLAADEKIQEAADIIANARFPMLLVGNGVIRNNACQALRSFVETLHIPAANTFMSKGAIPFSHEMSLGTIGLQTKDYVACGIDRTDAIICAGYDIVEYHPRLWNPEKSKTIIHIGMEAAEVDESYVPKCSLIGNIASSLRRLEEKSLASRGRLKRGQQDIYSGALRDIILEDFSAHAEDSSVPMKPQKILWDVRQALAKEDIVICDVGAHKMWTARMYQTEEPNTCIISNGFASMGIAVPGAIAARLVHPERSVLAITGDAGFMMNSQEIETALRVNTPFVVLIWNDDGYGLIAWHQMKHFNRTSHVDFKNPDFVKYAESMGAKGHRISAGDNLVEVIRQAFREKTVVVIDCPVDYSVNMEFSKNMGKLICPI